MLNLKEDANQPIKNEFLSEFLTIMEKNPNSKQLGLTQKRLSDALKIIFANYNDSDANLETVKENIEIHTNLLYTLIDNINDMVCAIDKDYKVLLLNQPYKDYLKNYYDIEIDTGDNLLKVATAANNAEWLQFYQRTFEGESFSIVKERYFKNQTWFFEITFNPLYNQNSDIIGISWFSKNISSQKQLEKQLRTQNEELRVVNQELDRFVYSASHDLRAPLSSLLGLINLVRIEEEQKNLSMYLDMMSRSINKMDSFIKEIIYHSKNTRLEVVSNEIDFESLLQDILEDLHFMEGGERILKTIEVKQAEKFYSDKNRLRVVLNNLLSNAIRYSDLQKAKSFIKATVKVKKKQAVIKIKDNGQGIHQEHLTKVFEMFYRASSDTKGSGLGLYMVKETIDKLKGIIEVDSEYTEGTTFIIKIPSLQ